MTFKEPHPTHLVPYFQPPLFHQPHPIVYSFCLHMNECFSFDACAIVDVLCQKCLTPSQILLDSTQLLRHLIQLLCHLFCITFPDLFPLPVELILFFHHNLFIYQGTYKDAWTNAFMLLSFPAFFVFCIIFKAWYLEYKRKCVIKDC